MPDIGTTWPLRHMSGLIGGIWLSAIDNTCYMLASRISSLVDIHSQYGLNSLLTSFRKYLFDLKQSKAQICVEIYPCSFRNYLFELKQKFSPNMY